MNEMYYSTTSNFRKSFVKSMNIKVSLRTEIVMIMDCNSFCVILSKQKNNTFKHTNSPTVNSHESTPDTVHVILEYN